MTGFVKKTVFGGVLAATVLSVAAPAEAQYYRGYRHRGGGDAAAGALIGGIVGLGLGAAIASSNNRDRYYDRGYYYGPQPRGSYYNSYPQSYYNSYPQPYYNDYRYNYRPRCYVERQYDPYYGRGVNVRVCR